MNAIDERQIADVACTVCGCVCDDLTAVLSGNRLVRVDKACPLAEPHFAAVSAVLEDATIPAARIAGQPVELDAAIERAADLLRTARQPLIFGLSRSSTSGQRAACRLADDLGAQIDTTASLCHGPSIMAIQQVGESTCSLGEIRHRADLVIYWGADPLTTHPRHLERYGREPVGEFVPRGAADRTLVVIDCEATATGEVADWFLQVPAGRDFELIWALRLAIAGLPLPGNAVPGISNDEVLRLAEHMKGCRYGVVFFGLGLAQTGIGHANVTGLLQLVAELNAHTRFTARRLRIPGDVTGADCVLCWQTGFPFGVSLSRGYPRYNPGEYTANELLERREVDVCLLVGAESVPRLSSAARQTLAAIPTIVLDYPHAPIPLDPAVHITTAIYGIHAAGTAYRMDEVPLPLRKILDSRFATDEEILGRIHARTLVGQP